jgi:hypothetical protein
MMCPLGVLHFQVNSTGDYPMTISTRQIALAIATSSAAALIPATAIADAGLMVGAGGYYSRVDDSFDLGDISGLDDINFDDSSFAYTLAVGYRFNNWLSVDAGYWDLGDYKSDPLNSGNKSSFDATAWTAGGMASVPLFFLDVYARGGAAFWETDGRLVNDDSTDLYYGVGVAFNFFRSMDVYAEWVRFDLDAALDTFGVGFRYTF